MTQKILSQSVVDLTDARDCEIRVQPQQANRATVEVSSKTSGVNVQITMNPEQARQLKDSILRQLPN